MQNNEISVHMLAQSTTPNNLTILIIMLPFRFAILKAAITCVRQIDALKITLQRNCWVCYMYAFAIR